MNKIEILGLIYNDRLNFKNHIKNGTKKKKDILTRIKQKFSIIKKSNIF